MAAKAGAAEVVIKFKNTGREQVEASIRKIVRETQKASRDIERSNARARQKAEAEAKREAATKTREADRTAKAIERRNASMRRSQVREAMRAFREEQREAKRAADEEKKRHRELERSHARMRRAFVKESQRAFRETERAARQAEMAERRSTQRFRRGLAATAVGVGAVGSAAIGASQRAQGVLGIRSQDDVLASAQDVRLNFLRTSRGAGLSADQRSEVSRGAINIGTQTGLGPEAVFGMIGANQELFSGLAAARENNQIPQFMESMRSMAQFSVATGSAATDVVTMHGAMMRQLGMSTQEADDALLLLAQGAQDGSLNISDMAGSFAGILAPFAQLRGSEGRGIGALQEFQAIAQALKASDVQTGQDARTLQSNMFNAFQNEETRERMRRAGVNIMEDDGRGGQRLRNVGSIVAQMARDEDFQGVALGEIVHDAQARQALQALISQEQQAMRGQAGAMSLSQRQRISTVDQGRELVGGMMADIASDPAGRAMRMRAEREGSVFENQDRLTSAMIDIAEPLTNLQNEFPLLTAALEELAPVMQMAMMGLFARAVLPGSFMSNQAPVTGASALANVAARGAPAAAVGAPANAAAAALGGLGAKANLVSGAFTVIAGLQVAEAITTNFIDPLLNMSGGDTMGEMRQQFSEQSWGSIFDDAREAFGSLVGSGRLADVENDAAQMGRIDPQEMARRRAEAAEMKANTTAIQQGFRSLETAVRESAGGAGNTGDTRANGQSQ